MLARLAGASAKAGPQARFARYHDHVDVAFRAWRGPWRIDDCVALIRVPILIIQGEGDEYGTIAQVRLAEEEAYCPVEAVVLADCRHSPHVDQPDATLEAIAEFVNRLLAVHEGLMPAG